jgi:predicted CXXCH cytochrome family protein
VSTLLKGHYFIRVNSLPNDLVPTKLDNPLAATNQFVGKTLRTSVIGTLAAPKYKFVTYSLGQAQHTVVGYTNGLTATPIRYGYALLYSSLKKLETRVMGTAALLASVPLGHHSTATWVVGPTNHGKSINSSCTDCHGSATSKPATYASINSGDGWCYKCHYGSAGVSSGLVDPKK